MFASAEQLTDATKDVDSGLCEKILAARTMFEVALREEVVRTPVNIADPVLANYLRARLGNCSDERVWAVFLDADNGFITDECVGEGARGRVHVRERFLFERAFDLQAFGIILAHNHPSASPQPSASDIEVTRQIINLSGRLGISVVDHLIIAGSQVTSMRKGEFL